MSTPNNKDVPPSMKGTAATESARPLGSRTALTYGAAIGVMGLGYWWYTHRNLQDTKDLYRAKDLNPASTIERSLDRDRPVSTTSYNIKQDKMPSVNLSTSTPSSGFGPTRNESMSERASRVGTDLKDLAAPITDPTSTGLDTAKRAAVDLKETVKDTADRIMNKPLDDSLSSRESLSEKARDAKDYVKEKAYDAKESMKDTMRRDARDVKEKAYDAKESMKDTMRRDARDSKEYVKDKVEDAKDYMKDKAADAKDYVKEKAYDAKESVKDTMRSMSPSRDTRDYVKDKAADAKDYVKDKAYEAKETAKDTMRSMTPSRDTREYVKDKAYDAKESAKDAVRDTKDYIKDKSYDAKERVKETGYEAKDATRRAVDRIEDGARHMRETGDKERYIAEVDKYANMPSDVKDRVLAREQADWHGVSGNMPENLRSNVDTKPTSSHNAAVKARVEAEKDRAIMTDSSRGMVERAKAAGDFVVEKASEMYHEPFSGSKKKTSA